MSEPIRCPLCGAEMNLIALDSSSYWQCKDNRFHRISMVNWSNIVHGIKSESEVASTIRNLEGWLLAQQNLAKDKH